MNNLPLSVVMGVYNGAEYLSAAIESLLNQTFPHFELLIINDASTDHTPNILDHYQKQDKRIRVFHNKTNQGIAVSRNRGLKLAQGETIAFMDADDVAYLNRFEIQYHYLNNHPDIFLVAGSARLINKEGKRTGIWNRQEDPETIAKQMPKENLIILSTVLFQNEGNHFFRNFRESEDYDFLLRLLSQGKKFAILPNLLIEYRLVAGPPLSKRRAQRDLFTREIQTFYQQRQENGQDTWSDFDPNPILNLDMNTTTNPMVWRNCIESAFSQNQFSLVRQLIHNHWSHLTHKKKLILLWLLSWTGKRPIFLLRTVRYLVKTLFFGWKNPPSNPGNLAYFLTIGLTLSVFESIGTLSRETKILKALAARGWEISLYSYDKTKKIPKLDFPATVYGQWPFRLPPKTNLLYPLMLPLLRFFSGHHNHILLTVQGYSSWPAIFCAWFWRSKIIVRCGYVEGEEFQSKGRSGLRVSLRMALEKWTFKHADRCLIPTQMLAEWVQKNYGIRKEKCDVVPNFVDTDLFSPNPTLKTHYDVICIGRLNQQKRVLLILEALKQSNLSILFIGRGEEKQTILNVSQQHNMQVKIIDSVVNEDLPTFLQQSRVYLIASIWEGHPKSLIEAMACGCGCVGTFSPGIQNLIVNGKTGLLVDPTPEQIAHAVSKLINTPKLCHTLGENARRFAMEHFAFDVILKRYEHAINSVLYKK